jgi:hypothetical protein
MFEDINLAVDVYISVWEERHVHGELTLGLAAE